jgi:hypothetical protein
VLICLTDSMAVRKLFQLLLMSVVHAFACLDVQTKATAREQLDNYDIEKTWKSLPKPLIMRSF